MLYLLGLVGVWVGVGASLGGGLVLLVGGMLVGLALLLPFPHLLVMVRAALRCRLLRGSHLPQLADS